MPTLKVINNYQKKLFGCLLVIILLGVVFCLTSFIFFFLYLFLDYLKIYIILFSVSIGLFALCFVLYIYLNNYFNKLFINQIIQKVLNELYDDYFFALEKSISKEIIERSFIYGEALISVQSKNFLAIKLGKVSLQSYEINVNETDYHHRRLNGVFIHFIFQENFFDDIIIFPRIKEDYINFQKGEYELMNNHEMEPFCVYTMQETPVSEKLKRLSKFLLNKYANEIFFISIKGKELFIQIEKINNYNLSVYHPFYKKDYLKLKEDLKIYQEIKDIMEL